MNSKPMTLLVCSSTGASLLAGLPLWCVITLAMATTALTATRVIVTQIIRLRATSKITRSAHALRLLEIQDNPRSLPTRQSRDAGGIRKAQTSGQEASAMEPHICPPSSPPPAPGVNHTYSTYWTRMATPGATATSTNYWPATSKP